MYAALSIIQGGVEFPLLHPALFTFIRDGKFDYNDIDDASILNPNVFNLVKEVIIVDFIYMYLNTLLPTHVSAKGM